MGAAAFAVTTRSHLRGLRFFPVMMIASLRIRRQLERAPGCVRFASVVAGPREFWTVTVWDSRDRMFDFMRSGEHERIMWRFSRWLDSFWLMRWRPTQLEEGKWGARRLCAEQTRSHRHRLDEQQRAALDAALGAMPRLAEAVGPEGAPTFDSSPGARRHHLAVEGSAAIMVRIVAPRLHQVPRAWAHLRGLRRHFEDNPEAMRVATGLSKPKECYALAVLRDERAAAAFLEHPEHNRLRTHWRDGYWAMAWEPANEFGHWDGFRLRQERKASALKMTGAAKRVSESPSVKAR